MNFPINEQDLFPLVYDLFPDATFSEGENGELVIWTGLKIVSSDGFIAPIET